MKILVNLQLLEDDGTLIDEKVRSVSRIPGSGTGEHLFDSVVLVLEIMFKTFGGIFSKTRG